MEHHEKNNGQKTWSDQQQKLVQGHVSIFTSAGSKQAPYKVKRKAQDSCYIALFWVAKRFPRTTSPREKKTHVYKQNKWTDYSAEMETNTN